MDPSDLFKQPLANKGKKPNPEKKRVCISDTLPYLPLIYGLKDKLIQHNFSLVIEEPYQALKRLQEGEVELGIIPSVEYGQKKETWRIIPDIAVSSKGAAKDMLLFFHKGLKDIKNISIDDNASISLLLLKILIKEKFILNPEYIKMEPHLDTMLAQTDAAFITGEKAFEYARTNQNYLDLGEEWEDLTGLPFVYAFWAGREFTIKKEEVNIIKNAFELGKRNLMQISKEYAENNSEDWVYYHDFLTHNRNYTFSDHERDGLMELYHYAFYYGFIKYIPDLYYYEI
jgi:chorismate dehydratase